MTSTRQFTSRLSQLAEWEKSNEYLKIIDELNEHFDSDANKILEKWTSAEPLSTEENQYLKFYSNIHLSLVKYCLFHSNTKPEIQALIDKLLGRLFQVRQIETLAETVNSIRNQQSDGNPSINENDPVFVDLMKLIDARSLTYRLIADVDRANVELDDALNDCLLHSQTKSYLRDVLSNKDTPSNQPITYQHQFFLGCCTFGVALFQGNKEKLKDDEKYDKHICSLVKYVRIMLNRTDSTDNPSIHYCLRGIFALLTNSIPHAYWLDIMNKGLIEDADENAQMKNPFNLDLFSLIINKLLTSEILQEKTKQSTLNDETLLIDSTMVFLVRWADTERNTEDNEDEKSSSTNQLLHNLQCEKAFERTTQILIPYIDAKYDRLRLLTLAILSILMNNQDFEKFKSVKPHMAKDLIELTFNFLDRASKEQEQKYKGISVDTLLHYLYRFLIQDFIKRETLPYLPNIIAYAKALNEYAVKILRRLTTDSEVLDQLRKDQNFKQFVDKDADVRFPKTSRLYPTIVDIRQNVSPPAPSPPKSVPKSSASKHCQAFISYSHKEKDKRKFVEQKLTETGYFTKIWVDDNYMRGSAYETVARAINQSKVVFVLVSDHFCASDFCRREWKYAVQLEIKVYIIFVQEDFDKQKYDWVGFLTVDEIYYKLHRDADMPKLIEDLGEYLKKKNPDQRQTTTTRRNSMKRDSIAAESNGEHLPKTSVDQWTVDDVQNWCSNNHLQRWRKPLQYFDGQTLIKLRRDLSNDQRLQLINRQYDLDLFEITRFKNEIDKIMPSPKTKIRPKRRTSKTITLAKK